MSVFSQILKASSLKLAMFIGIATLQAHAQTDPKQLSMFRLNSQILQASADVTYYCNDAIQVVRSNALQALSFGYHSTIVLPLQFLGDLLRGDLELTGSHASIRCERQAKLKEREVQHLQAICLKSVNHLSGLIEERKRRFANYVDLKSESERAEQSEFEIHSLQSISRIEIVRNGQIDEVLVDRIPVLRGLFATENFQWLQVRRVDILRNQIRLSKDGISFPFMVDVRHKVSGLNQGSLVVLGLIKISPNCGSASVSAFGDSQLLEKMGRNIGFIDGRDFEFVQKLLIPILTSELQRNEVLTELSDLQNRHSVEQ